MSVLIPNMDKPKSCNPCDKSYWYCPMLKNNNCALQSDDWDTWDEQYEHCPLIEVKEGGDT